MDNALIFSLGPIILLLILLVLGVHIGIALGLTGFLGLTLLVGFSAALSITKSGLYYTISTYELIPLPLFVLMGLLAAGGGVSEKLYEMASLWMGKFKGGLGVATVFGCTGFGAVCGSSMVTAAVFAKVSAPEMRKQGYDKKIAYGICCASGMIGILIPPSTLLFLYAIMSGESVATLLIGGTTPGLLLAFTFIIVIIAISKVKPDLMRIKPLGGITWRRRFAVIPGVWPIIVVAIIIFGGMFGGVFNATEASGVGAFVLIMLVLIVRRNLAPKVIISAFTESVTITAMVFLIMGAAAVFTRFLTLSGITTWFANIILGLNLSNIGVVIGFCVVYLILGCFLNGVAMLLMTVPLFHPIIVSLGIDSIWYSLVAVFVMEIGVLTPPVGLNVYSTQAVAEPDVSVEDVFTGSLPFFIVSLIALVVLIVFPDLSTWLPSKMIPMR